MKIYLIRHAEARGIGGPIVRDADRPLTAEGEEQAAVMGRVLVAVEPGAVVLASSPLLRARRTAELVGGVYAQPPTVEVWDELSPGVSFRGVAGKIAGRGEGALVLVGHQPDMSNLLAYLVADAAVELVMPPCAIAMLSAVPGPSFTGARLHWLLTPEIVRKLQSAS